MEVKKQLQMAGDSSTLAIFLFVNKAVLPPSGLASKQLLDYWY